MKIVIFFVTMSALIVNTGCFSNRDKSGVSKDPSVVLLAGAAMHVEKLAKDGILPGFSKTEHGMIRSQRMEAGSAIVYPAEITLQVEKATEVNEIFWFVLKKDSERAHWIVIKAWKTDIQGENKMNLISN